MVRGGGFQEGCGPWVEWAISRLGRGSPDASPAAVDDYELPSHLELPSFAPPAQLAPTIYPSEEGVTERGALGPKGQGRVPHMLSTAVRIHLDPHKNIKVQPHLLWPTHLAGAAASLVHGGLGSHCTDCAPPPQEFLVTLRLHRATLRHYMALPEQSWHSQVREGAMVGRSLGWEEAGVRGMAWAEAGFPGQGLW